MANFQSTIELKAITRDIDKKLKGVRQSLGGVNKEAQESTKRMSAFSNRGERNLSRVNKSAGKLNKTFKGLNSKIKGMTTGIKIFGGIFTTVVAGKAVASAAAFEKGMSAVRATTNANTADMKKLTGEALRLGSTTKFTAGEASEAMLKLSMAGFSAQETFKATADTLALASAGALGLGESADIASNVLAGFDLKVKDLARVTDVMAKAASKSNTSVQELGSALSYVGPVAEQSSLSIEDTVAAIGKLSDSGIKGTRAGTNVRAMLLRLQKPSAEASRYLSKLGIETRNAEGKFRPFIQIMKEFGEATQDSADFAAVFGRVASSGAGVLAKAAVSGDIQTLGASLREANGAAKKMADIRLDNLTGSVTLMTSAWDGLIQALLQGKALHFMQDSVEGLTAVFGNLKVKVDSFDSDYGESLRNIRDITSSVMAYTSGEFKAFFDIMNYGPNYVFERFIASLKTLGANILGFVYSLRIDTVLQKMYNSVLNVLIDVGLLFVKFYAMGPVRSWNTFWGTSFIQPIENVLTVLGGKIQGKFISFWTEFLPEKILTVKLKIILSATQFIIERWVKGLAGTVGKLALTVWSSLVTSLEAAQKTINKISERFTKSFLGIFNDFGKEVAKSASKFADILEDVLKLVGIEVEFDGISDGVFDGFIKQIKKFGKLLSNLVGKTISKSLKLFGRLGEGFVRVAEDIYDGVVGAFHDLYMKLIGGSIIPDIVDQSTDRWKILRKSFDSITTALVGETIGSWKNLFDVMARTTADISTRMIFHWISMSAVLSSTTAVMSLYVGSFSRKAAGSLNILNNIVMKNRHAIDSLSKSYAGLSKFILPFAVLLNARHIKDWAINLKEGIQSQDWNSVGRSIVAPIDFQFSTIINLAHKVATLSAKYIGRSMKEVVGHTERYLPKVTKAIGDVKDSLESFFDRNILLGSIKTIIDAVAGMFTSITNFFTGFSSESVGGLLVNAFFTVQGIKIVLSLLKKFGLAVWAQMLDIGAKSGASFMTGFDAGFMKKRAAFEAKLKAWETGRAAGNVMGARPVMPKDAMHVHEKMMKGLNTAFTRAGAKSRELFDKLKMHMMNFDLSQVGRAFSGLFSRISGIAGLVKKNASMGPSVAGATLGGKAGISGLVGKLAKYKIFSRFIRKENEKTAVHAASANAAMGAATASSSATGKKAGNGFKMGMGSVLAGVGILSMFSMSSANASEFGEDVGQSVTEGIEKALKDEASGSSLMGILMETALYGSMLIGTGIYTKIGEAFVKARAFIWPFALRLAAALSLGSLGIGAVVVAITAGFVAATVALGYGIYKAGKSIEEHIIDPIGFAMDDLADKMARAGAIQGVETKDIFGDWDESLGFFRNLKKSGQNFGHNIKEDIDEAGRMIGHVWDRLSNKAAIALIDSGWIDAVDHMDSVLLKHKHVLEDAGMVGMGKQSAEDITNVSIAYTIKEPKALGDGLLDATVELDKNLEKLWNKYANTTPKWIENFDLKGIKKELHGLINAQVAAGTMEDDNWFFDDAEEAVEYVDEHLKAANISMLNLNKSVKDGSMNASEYKSRMKSLTFTFKKGAADAGIAIKDSFELMPKLMMEVIAEQGNLNRALNAEADLRADINKNAWKGDELVKANQLLQANFRRVHLAIKGVHKAELKGFAEKFQWLEKEHKKKLEIAKIMDDFGLMDLTSVDSKDIWDKWLEAKESMLSTDEKSLRLLKKVTKEAEFIKKISGDSVSDALIKRFIMKETGELDEIMDRREQGLEDAKEGVNKVEQAHIDLNKVIEDGNKILAATPYNRQSIVKDHTKILKDAAEAKLALEKAEAVKEVTEKKAEKKEKDKKVRLAALDMQIREFNLTARAAQRTVEGLGATFTAATLTLEKEFEVLYGEGWREIHKDSVDIMVHFNRIKLEMERKHQEKILLLAGTGMDGVLVGFQRAIRNMRTEAELFEEATRKSLDTLRNFFGDFLKGNTLNFDNLLDSIWGNFQDATFDNLFNDMLKNSGVDKLLGIGERSAEITSNGSMKVIVTNPKDIALGKLTEVEKKKENSISENIGRLWGDVTNWMGFGGSKTSESSSQPEETNQLGENPRTEEASAGGLISGPGTGTSDSIPAMLSNGEFVVNARGAAKHRSLLDHINAGAGVQGFATGTPPDGSSNFKDMPSVFNEEIRPHRKNLVDLLGEMSLNKLRNDRKDIDYGDLLKNNPSSSPVDREFAKKFEVLSSKKFKEVGYGRNPKSISTENRLEWFNKKNLFGKTQSLFDSYDQALGDIDWQTKDRPSQLKNHKKFMKWYEDIARELMMSVKYGDMNSPGEWTVGPHVGYNTPVYDKISEQIGAKDFPGRGRISVDTMGSLNIPDPLLGGDFNVARQIAMHELGHHISSAMKLGKVFDRMLEERDLLKERYGGKLTRPVGMDNNMHLNANRFGNIALEVEQAQVGMAARIQEEAAATMNGMMISKGEFGGKGGIKDAFKTYLTSYAAQGNVRRNHAKQDGMLKANERAHSVGEVPPLPNTMDDFWNKDERLNYKNRRSESAHTVSYKALQDQVNDLPNIGKFDSSNWALNAFPENIRKTVQTGLDNTSIAGHLLWDQVKSVGRGMNPSLWEHPNRNFKDMPKGPSRDELLAMSPEEAFEYDKDLAKLLGDKSPENFDPDTLKKIGNLLRDIGPGLIVEEGLMRMWSDFTPIADMSGRLADSFEGDIPVEARGAIFATGVVLEEGFKLLLAARMGLGAMAGVAHLKKLAAISENAMKYQGMITKLEKLSLTGGLASIGKDVYDLFDSLMGRTGGDKKQSSPPSMEKQSSSMLAFASGGQVSGAGSGTSDSIPAMLSNGEFVINARETAKHRNLLEQINSGKGVQISSEEGVQKFAAGGFVGMENTIQSLMTSVMGASELFDMWSPEEKKKEEQEPGQSSAHAFRAGGMGGRRDGQSALTALLVQNVTGDMLEKEVKSNATQAAYEAKQKDDQKKIESAKGEANKEHTSTFGSMISEKWTSFSEVLKEGWKDLGGMFDNLFSGIGDLFSGDGIMGSIGKMGGAGGEGGLFGAGGIFGGDSYTGDTKGANFVGPTMPTMPTVLAASTGGLVPKYFSDGGVAHGTDTVPAMLTPGEVVLNAAQQSNVAGAINSPMGEGIAQSGGIAATGGSGGEGGKEKAPTDPLSYLQLLIQKQREATSISSQEANARMAVLGQEETEGGAIVAGGEENKAAAVEEGEQMQQESRKKSAVAQKAIAMIGAGIAMALGITKALSLDWPKNLIMASLIGAMGAVQIAKIASTKVRTGGMVTHAGVDLSEGGKLRGAGSGTSDSIPAMLSNGEYVINAAQTKKYGAVLAAINADKSEREVLGRMTNRPVGAFASGGVVGSAPVLNRGEEGITSGAVYNTTHVNVSGNVDQRSIDQIRKVISQSPKQVRGASEQGKRNKTGLRKS
jgi:TP901 family phage tail tape measure protein